MNLAVGFGYGEGYYLATARHLALSYFDQPPLSLWIAHAALALFGAGSTLLPRLPFIVLFAANTWLMYRLGARLFGEAAGAWAAVLLNLSPLFTISVGGWVQPDAPLFFFLTAAAIPIVDICFGAPRHPWRAWALAGACFGLAMLSKYHAALVLAGLLIFAATTPSHRARFFKPPVLLACVIAAVLFSPVLIWNLQNHEASFAFQSGRIVRSAGLRFDWLARSLLGQAVEIGIVIWPLMMIAFARALGVGPRDPRTWLLCCLAIVPIIVFTAAALWAPLGWHFHWQAPGYLYLFPLLGKTVAEGIERGRKATRNWLIASAGILVLFVSLVASQAATGWLSGATSRQALLQDQPDARAARMARAAPGPGPAGPARPGPAVPGDQQMVLRRQGGRRRRRQAAGGVPVGRPAQHRLWLGRPPLCRLGCADRDPVGHQGRSGGGLRRLFPVDHAADRRRRRPGRPDRAGPARLPRARLPPALPTALWRLAPGPRRVGRRRPGALSAKLARRAELCHSKRVSLAAHGHAPPGDCETASNQQDKDYPVSTTAQPSSSAADTAAIGDEAMKAQVAASLHAAETFDAPYRHWLLRDLFEPQIAQALTALPFEAPDLGGVSGARELHNDTRRYFDHETTAAFPVCRTVAETFQDPQTVASFAQATGADLDGCCLRIEYAQDVSGFWLKPHTDLGVKRLTLLAYLAEPQGQEDLGTDLYADENTWIKRSPCACGAALLFVPSGATWHGFEPRAFDGVRKTVIINYVTAEWRAREQLAYPDQPVCAASSLRTA
jgi:hypothetical protein